jgi:SulP family sulfate permease
MFLLVVLTGMFLIGFGLLRLGRLVRFVSHAVMTGFLIGVAVVLILGQAAPFVGVNPEGRNEITQFLALLTDASTFSLPTILTGALALALMVGLARTRLASAASLLALVLPTVAVLLLGWHDVQQVSDVGIIPQGLPPLSLPNLSLLTPDLALAAAAVAVVIGVQGAGVSLSVENPDNRPVSSSRDLLAQGAGNVAAGLISGIPAGGSVGQTALNVRVGARSRWGGIFGGLWMLVIVLLIPGLVGYVPMAVLAALMIVSGISAIDLGEVRSIWRTSPAARWSILVTFVATLVLSIPQAVGVGVLLSVTLHLFSQASDVRVRALIRREDGSLTETAPPASLPSRAVTVLHAYGSLFFAGARTLRETLPDPAGSEHPVGVLRLRGRTRVGATLIDVLDDYAADLAEVGVWLYRSGVEPDVARQLRDTGKLDPDEAVRIFPADAVVGASTSEAVAQAGVWLGRLRRLSPNQGSEPSRSGNGQ